MPIFIKDIMTSEVTTVLSESTVEQSETTMLKTNRRCVPVIDNLGICVGVLSHGDILRVRNTKKDVASIFVRDIMSPHIVSISPHCSADDAMELMIDNSIHHVLVIMSSRVVGMISVLDIIKVDRAQTINRFDDSESYVTAN
tara:strand:+ start:30845 stop:31270 length:426 start_codon:yes stop_codon:yes gene_type:complete